VYVAGPVATPVVAAAQVVHVTEVVEASVSLEGENSFTNHDDDSKMPRISAKAIIKTEQIETQVSFLIDDPLSKVE